MKSISENGLARHVLPCSIKQAFTLTLSTSPVMKIFRLAAARLVCRSRSCNWLPAENSRWYVRIGDSVSSLEDGRP